MNVRFKSKLALEFPLGAIVSQGKTLSNLNYPSIFSQLASIWPRMLPTGNFKRVHYPGRGRIWWGLAERSQSLRR